MQKEEKKDIYVAVLAGGKGERLWPKSRISLPKQNLALFGRKTFLQQAVRRAAGISGDNIFIVTSKAASFHGIRQFKKSGIKKIIVEPFGRNTEPAVGLAALMAFRENEDSVLVAMPSDAMIKKEKRFFEAISAAVAAARRRDAIVTLGIKPASAETAYGYIGISKKISFISGKSAQRIEQFIEKPAAPIAEKLVKSKRFFWNSGIFIFKTSAMLKALKKYDPPLYHGLMALPEAKERRHFESGLNGLYRKIESRSLDYAVLEKAENVEVVPSDFEWTDLGSFESIARLAKRDKEGNLVCGKHIGLDTSETIVFADSGRLVATIGSKGLMVIASADAVLVCDREKAGDIKKLLDKMKKDKSLARFL